MLLNQSLLRLQKFWEENKIYTWESSGGDSFIIDTPPPTVSGTLHMGHIFSYTHIDFLARYKRMNGKNVFYPIGFDDNGLPTERLVEKQRKIKANQFSREEFRKICREVIAFEENKFKDLFKSMGYSIDWDLAYTTVSPHSIRLSQMSFLDLIAKNQVYRKNQPVFWDPIDQTVLAQSELDDHEKNSFMYKIPFFVGPNRQIHIATTRPELLASCVAVFVHPDDSRYNDLAGQYATTPLFKTCVQIIADENVVPEKGTGIVMCSTFGDTTDVLWWKKHNLATRIILDKEARLTDFKFDPTSSQDPSKADLYYSQIKGMKTTHARLKVIEMLNNEGFDIISTPVISTIKCAERSKAPIEILMMPQWFIKTTEHKEAILKISQDIKWHPSFMRNRLHNWINAISSDWCISRQRFFGVPFPIWYSKRKGEEGKILLPLLSDLPLDPLEALPKGYTKEEVVPEKDVMDTWATSCISPQLNSHAITEEFAIDLTRHKKLFPADLRPQSHEIIRTWAFGTILKSYLHSQDLPWKNVMISGWCLADDKSKMSKSKGNIINPLEIIRQYGVDPLRYWAASGSLGHDTIFSHDVCLQGKKLVTKLKNAANFCFLHLNKYNFASSILEEDLENKNIHCTADLWLIASLDNTIKKVSNFLEEYEYSKAKEIIERFFWKDFCDTYLELTKKRIYGNNSLEGQKSGILTLYYTLKSILFLFSPFIPFTTEEIYIDVLGMKESIHKKGNWPQPLKNNFVSVYQNYDHFIFPLLEEVRKQKTERKLSMKAPLRLLQIRSKKFKITDDLIEDLRNVTCSDTIEVLNSSSDKLNLVKDQNDLEFKIMF